MDPTEHATRLLDGKVVLVTGAASGIGHATALLAATEGASGLVITDRDGDGLKETEVALDVRGIAAEAVVAPIEADGVAEQLVAAAVDRFDRLDVAVNNAGVRGRLATVDAVDDALWDEVHNVNLRAVFRCMRAQLGHMYSQGAGAVVNVASASVFGVSSHLAPYVASKMGVIGISKVAAAEAGPHGVRVNVVCPGRTATPLFGSHASGDGPPLDRLVAEIPLGRLGEPTELGEAIVWLCCDRASFVTGEVLVVDGGRTIG